MLKLIKKSIYSIVGNNKYLKEFSEYYSYVKIGNYTRMKHILQTVLNSVIAYELFVLKWTLLLPFSLYYFGV